MQGVLNFLYAHLVEVVTKRLALQFAEDLLRKNQEILKNTVGMTG